MTFPTMKLVNSLFLFFSMLALIAFLSACSQNGGNLTDISVPTPTPTPTPKLNTYTGNGLSIQYPFTWQQNDNSDTFAPGMTIDFQAPSSNTVTHLSITVLPANPGGSMDELLYYITSTNEKQYSHIQQASPNSTTTFAGITWHAATLTASYKSIPIKEVDMAGQDSSTGKVYYLVIRDTASTYDQTNTTIFQPMLQSLRFS